MRFHDHLKALIARFSEYRRTQVEMYERYHILLEPWSHDVLHWGADGTLHGTIVAGQVRSPVTRGGWCPCHPIDGAVGPGLGDGRGVAGEMGRCG